MSICSRSILLSICVFCCATIAVAQVAPTSIFQLNGNPGGAAVTTCTYGVNSGQTCDNWNLLNGSGSATATVIRTQTPPSASGNWNVRTYVPGVFDTFNFQGGGSKDANLISQWAYTSTSSPNKDTLDAAYAAAYTQGGDFEVIFGADRLSPNGDANIGIWFFQQAVGPNGSGGFTGAHVNGDIFIISAFTGGGGTSTISVYAWNSACTAGVRNPQPKQCADANLELVAAPTTVCTLGSGYCAITNSSTVNASWATAANGYTTGGQLVSPLFFEGGVDITYALAQVGITQLPCFSSFLMETRSSQSTTAVLKDFLAGGFPVCGMHVTKACGTAAVDGSGNFFDYPVTGTVQNTGVGTLYLVGVTDVITLSNGTKQTVTPTVTPSTLSAGQTGTWSYTIQDPGTSVSDTVTASGNTASNGSGTVVNSDNADTETCSTSLTTQLSISKSCGIPANFTGPNTLAVPGTTLVASGNGVEVQVAFSGQVCNTGDSAITNITLADYQGTLTNNTKVVISGPTGLGPATGTCTTDPTTKITTCSVPTCANYSGTYVPSNIDVIALLNGTATGAGRYFFNDQTVITGAKSAIGNLQAISAPGTNCDGTFGCSTTASCPICQGPGECTAQ